MSERVRVRWTGGNTKDELRERNLEPQDNAVRVRLNPLQIAILRWTTQTATAYVGSRWGVCKCTADPEKRPPPRKTSE